MAWSVEVLNEVVREELRTLPKDMRAKIGHTLHLMETYGPQALHEPRVKQLRGKLWEIRVIGEDGIARAVYFTAVGQRIVVVLAFQKKTQKTPARLIDLAETRAKELPT